jgi:hypothetical protein
VEVLSGLVDLDLQFDAAEKRRGGGVEDKPIGIGRETVRELPDTSVVVGLCGCQQLVSAVELDLDAGRGLATFRVQNVGRDGSGHGQRNSIPLRDCSIGETSSGRNRGAAEDFGQLKKAARLEGVLVDDLVLVGAGQTSLLHDLLTADVEAVDAVGGG